MMIFEIGFVIFSCVVWVQFEVEGRMVFGEFLAIGWIVVAAILPGGGGVYQGAGKNGWWRQ